MTMRTALLLCVLALACSCQRQIDHNGRTPLVGVGDMYLYAEDLENVRPLGLSRDDSVLFAEDYIRNWVQDALLWQKAVRNVGSSPDVNEMVEAYRHSLVLHLYQQALVNERVDTEVDTTEIDSFYRVHSDIYKLEYPLAKGLYIKVPLNDKEVNKVRQWYTRTDQESIEKLEKYSLQHAVDYQYFYNRWTRVDEIVKKLPVNVSNVSTYLKRHPEVEVKDTAFYYFLHIDSLLEVGDLKPVEYASGEIREALLNARRMDFMKRLRSQLYDEAQADGDVIYYYE